MYLHWKKILSEANKMFKFSRTDKLMSDQPHENLSITQITIIKGIRIYCAN